MDLERNDQIPSGMDRTDKPVERRVILKHRLCPFVFVNPTEIKAFLMWADSPRCDSLIRETESGVFDQVHALWTDSLYLSGMWNNLFFSERTSQVKLLGPLDKEKLSALNQLRILYMVGQVCMPVGVGYRFRHLCDTCVRRTLSGYSFQFTVSRTQIVIPNQTNKNFLLVYALHK